MNKNTNKNTNKNINFNLDNKEKIMKEKILSITIGALIGAVVVSSGVLISAKMNRKIGSLNGMPPMGQEQMQGLNGSMGQNGGPSNNGSQSGPMGQNGGSSNNGSQSGPMNQNGGTPPQMPNGGNTKNS